MNRTEAYMQIKEIIEPIHSHQEQMAAIAQWIASEFVHKSLVDPRVMLENSKKAQKWDELDEKISKFYPDDENDEVGDLGDIGEVAAMAFGYL